MAVMAETWILIKLPNFDFEIITRCRFEVPGYISTDHVFGEHDEISWTRSQGQGVKDKAEGANRDNYHRITKGNAQ
jgi:hypothetical protein